MMLGCVCLPFKGGNERGEMEEPNQKLSKFRKDASCAGGCTERCCASATRQATILGLYAEVTLLHAGGDIASNSANQTAVCKQLEIPD